MSGNRSRGWQGEGQQFNFGCRTLHPRPKGEGSTSARSLLVPRRPPPEEVQLQRPYESVLRATAAEPVPSSPRRRQRARRPRGSRRRGTRRTRWRRRLALLEVEVEVKIAAAEKEVAVAQGVFRRSGAEVSPRRKAIEVSPPCGNDARNRLGTQRWVFAGLQGAS